MASTAPATAALAALQIVALVLVPIIAPPMLIGSWPSLITYVLFLSVLSVVSAVVSRQDMAQIERQSRQLAESEARLREQSVRDALTGLFNRRFLEETLNRELRRAQRAQGTLGVLMIDIDHFKQFNDTYGHTLGDDVLRELSRLLFTHGRGSDIACRYGGEEFIVLLPGATSAVTRERAELICSGAGRLSLRYDGRAIEPITLAIGLAAFPHDGATGEALLKAADEALYRAKAEGRDRVGLA